MRALLLLALIGFSVAAADDYPVRPIRFIVAFPPGGPTDIVARIMARNLSEASGQSVVVDNRPGAGGNIATVIAARATPDGYTILVHSSAFAVNPSLFKKAGYDPVKEFAPVIIAGVTPNIIFVHPSVPAHNLKELIAVAERQKLSYASSGTGTTPHLTAELLLKTLARMEITHVPFSGAAPAVNAVVGGQVPVGSTALTAPLPLIKAGKLRAIVVTSPQRISALPDAQTAAEAGYPGYEDYTWIAFFAPAGTPEPIVNRLNRDIAKVLQTPEAKKRMSILGLEQQPNSPEQFSIYLKAEVAKWANVVKASGARVD